MGLNCYVIGWNGGGRIGSYSGVHILRKILISASIKFCINKIKKFKLITKN